MPPIFFALGYVEGATLPRRLGDWQVIAWALLLSLPIMLFLAILSTPYHWNRITPSAWTGLAYVVVVSMFVAFIFRYRGLAQGGIAKIGQLQLLQPFFGLLLSSLFLDKTITWSMIATALAIVGCMTGTKRFT